MPSSSRVDAQQQRLLELLRHAGGRPVTIADLRAAGIDFPAAVVSELELAGYAIDRVHERGSQVGVRLLEPERLDLASPSSRRRWPWTRRQDPPD
jgi:hypothetical protein